MLVESLAAGGTVSLELGAIPGSCADLHGSGSRRGRTTLPERAALYEEGRHGEDGRQTPGGASLARCHGERALHAPYIVQPERTLEDSDAPYQPSTVKP
jgi:hypothetical protein